MVARSEKVERPPISTCLTSEASTSSDSASRPCPSHDRPCPTDSTASSVNRVAKTPRSSRRARCSGGRRLTLQSIVARIVRWRSGRSRTDAVSRGRVCSRRWAMPSGVRRRTFAAASSIASGSPSRRRQMSVTAAAFSAVRVNSGLTACARSTNSCTAVDLRARSTLTGAVPSGADRPSTSYTCSPRMRSTILLVTKKVAVGATVYSLTRTGAAATICSKLSSTISTRRPSRAREMRSSRPASPLSRMPRK